MTQLTSFDVNVAEEILMISTHFQRRALAQVVSAVFAFALPTFALAGNANGATSNTNESYTQGNNEQGATSSRHSADASTRGSSANDMATPRNKSVANDRNFDDLWRRLDTNNDGQVSRAEFNAYHRADLVHANTSTQASTALQRQMRASDLIGMDVSDRSGDDVGQIKDLIVDTGSGKVRSAIVSFGGVLGVGDKLFRYPLSSFSRGDSDDLVLNVDERTLKSAQGFDRDDWAERKERNVWQASRLMGKDVVDRNGEHLGEIQDLAIDTRSGKIDYAVLKYDRPWRLDNPLVAMPLSSFNFGDGRHDVSMNLDRAQIDAQATSESNIGRNEPTGRIVTERWIFLFPTTASNAQNSSQATSADASPSATSASHGATNSADRNVSGTSNLSMSANANDRNPATSSSSSPTASAPTASDTATGAAPNGQDQSTMAPSTATTTRFNELDTNHDGRLDRQEFETGTGTAADFSNTDRNNDQSVTRDEFANRPNSMSQ
jgi:sporulation protein YlmC with PRC-barrel domain